MSFGLCPHTGKTFAQKFPPSAFQTFFWLSADVQFQRAQKIEAEHGDCKCSSSANCTNNHKYLFVMLNELDERGSIGCVVTCPGSVKECVFQCDAYPGDFVWLVIDPTRREEVEILKKYNKRLSDLLDDKRKNQWYYEALKKQLDSIEFDSESDD